MIIPAHGSLSFDPGITEPWLSLSLSYIFARVATQPRWTNILFHSSVKSKTVFASVDVEKLWHSALHIQWWASAKKRISLGFGSPCPVWPTCRSQILKDSLQPVEGKEGGRTSHEHWMESDPILGGRGIAPLWDHNRVREPVGNGSPPRCRHPIASSVMPTSHKFPIGLRWSTVMATE